MRQGSVANRGQSPRDFLNRPVIGLAEVTTVNVDDVLTHVDPSVFVADTARVIGEVSIARDSSVWFGAVIRGDIESVTIGEGTNIQDGAVVHVDPGYPCVIGRGVTLGHGAIVHGATIADNVMVGIGARVLTGAVVGENSIIGAGAVVTEGTIIPPNSLALGIPAKVVKEVTEEQAARIRRTAQRYINLARAYRERRSGRMV